ncbi:hypothetical protein HanIR_Chr01g0001131 [Helianthus annuus]|nr:hypothetical protein HanIR_Chr01g0001131 [Helianthus annuus]
MPAMNAQASFSMEFSSNILTSASANCCISAVEMLNFKAFCLFYIFCLARLLNRLFNRGIFILSNIPRIQLFPQNLSYNRKLLNTSLFDNLFIHFFVHNFSYKCL